jgi:SAM-dependent methyltransferase
MTETPCKPPEQRPEHPDFWNKRFDTGVTPWDAGRAPLALGQFIARQTKPLNTLIPGCGSAWDAALLAEHGWPVTALDFSPNAVATARTVLGDRNNGVNLVCADFFTHTPASPYTLIYERAFLCALPRKLWAEWGRRVAELLPPGSLLAGFFFLCDQAKGPPFGILPAQLDDLLMDNFERIEDAAVDDSIPAFSGRERWQIWQRR